MRLHAVTGPTPGRGVVRETEADQWDVLNSASPAHLGSRLRGPSKLVSRLLFRSQAAASGTASEMNLYRSFGNLLELWMTDRDRCSDSESLGNNDEDSTTPTSDVGTNLRSESVDSGVETASSDTSFPAACFSVSTDTAEIDTFTSPQSPVLSSPAASSPSSPSPRLCPSRAQGGSTALYPQTERALPKTDPKLPKDNGEPLTVDEVLRRRPRASFLPKRHTSEIVRGQRSEGFDLRRTVNPSMPVRQRSEMCRRPLSMGCDKQAAQTRSEDRGAEQRKPLSPGLRYLEQVCQMLEEIAKQQMHIRALQAETDAPRERQDVEALDTCQRHSKAAAATEVLAPPRRLENAESAGHSSTEQRKDYPKGHFRQRSASDTTVATLYLRTLNADCRGQHLGSDDLLEKVEEDHEKQESAREKTDKSDKDWKFKAMPSEREVSAVRDTKGQQMQSFEKNSARRRLSQLFKRKRKSASEKPV